MRRVGRLHAITDETLQSASLTASWLGFYENPDQRLPIISIQLFRTDWRPMVPASEYRSVAVANLVPRQFTAVHGHNLQGYPVWAKT